MLSGVEPMYVSMDGPLDRIIQTLVLLTDTASGMAHLHSHFLIHRDLAPRNVLVESTNQRAMVSDFGLSRKIKPEDVEGSPGEQEQTIGDQGHVRCRVSVACKGV